MMRPKTLPKTILRLSSPSFLTTTNTFKNYSIRSITLKRVMSRFAALGSMWEPKRKSKSTLLGVWRHCGL